MKKLIRSIMIFLSVCAAAQAVAAEEFGIKVPMIDKGAATYYVAGNIAGIGPVELMVDTGSGYVTINEEALKLLREEKRARYVKNLRGVLANGSEMIVPVYSISVLHIGKECVLRDVEAAVFPGKTRFILGLSALEKASPFIFSTNPPSLSLSNCSPTPAGGSIAKM